MSVYELWIKAVQGKSTMDFRLEEEPDDSGGSEGEAVLPQGVDEPAAELETEALLQEEEPAEPLASPTSPPGFGRRDKEALSMALFQGSGDKNQNTEGNNHAEFHAIPVMGEQGIGQALRKDSPKSLGATSMETTGKEGVLNGGIITQEDFGGEVEGNIIPGEETSGMDVNSPAAIEAFKVFNYQVVGAQLGVQQGE